MSTQAGAELCQAQERHKATAQHGSSLEIIQTEVLVEVPTCTDGWVVGGW